MDRRPCLSCSPRLLPLVALPLILAACAPGPGDDQAREVARNVRVMPLQTAAVTEFLEMAGPLLPVRGADIGSEEAGTVERIVHEKGSRVAAGDPLIVLDRRLLLHGSQRHFLHHLIHRVKIAHSGVYDGPEPSIVFGQRGLPVDRRLRGGFRRLF